MIFCIIICEVYQITDAPKFVIYLICLCRHKYNILIIVNIYTLAYVVVCLFVYISAPYYILNQSIVEGL